MAAADSKSDENLSGENVKIDVSIAKTKLNVDEHYIFRKFDIIFYILSIGVFISAILADLIVVFEHFSKGYEGWGYYTVALMVVPSCIVQLLSLTWFQTDRALKRIHWILHFFQLGILYRFSVLLVSSNKETSNTISSQKKDWILRMQSDAFTLNLYTSLFTCIPQIILQLYTASVLQHVPLRTCILVGISLCSLTWALISYVIIVSRIHQENAQSSWPELMFQGFWRGGMLTSRIITLVLASLCIKNWIFAFFSAHWLGMTAWIFVQNTDFCSTTLGECAYKCVISIVYFFDFLRLCESRARCQVCLFYSVMIIENATFYVIYLLYFKNAFHVNILIVSSVVILGGTFLGSVSMLIHFCMFQNVKSIRLYKRLNNKGNVIENPKENWQEASIDTSEAIVDTTADKKSLLVNIVQSTDFVETGIVNNNFQQTDETSVTIQVIVEDGKAQDSVESAIIESAITEDNEVLENHLGSLHRQKRRGICSEEELDLERADSSSQKRRGICSLTQLGIELVTDEDNYVEKNFLKSGESPSSEEKEESVTPSTKNVITRCIQSRGRLSTPVNSEMSEVSQKEETTSHVTSVHDYENLCPLGVARPPWCIRSWQGYTDIETYIHDDSVIRDRRRDTLTSTATGTTVSSDCSDTTYTSLPMRRLFKRSRQDDYLDTLIYDLVDRDTYRLCNDEASDIDEQDINLFAAKPIVIDDKGGMLALDTILEEREDSSVGSDLKLNLSGPNTCSVSSLVATIDEIRKCTAEYSPRHVYHRTESNWEDIEQQIFTKRRHLTKVLFSNDYSNVKFNYSDRWNNSFSVGINDKLSIIREMTNCCSKESTKKIPLISAILSDSPVLGSRTETQPCPRDDISLSGMEEDNVYVDMNALGAQVCNENLKKKQDLLSKDIKERVSQSSSAIKDFDKSNLGLSMEDNASDRCPKSVEQKSVTIPVKTTCQSPQLSSEKRRKSIIGRPRRKFSLLRERFEPKAEQIVCVMSPNSRLISNQSQLNKQISVIFNDPDPIDPVLEYEKKNLTVDGLGDNRQANLKERRSIFLKQVLSPPRFQGWGKKRTFSPNAKIMPKAL